MNFLEFTKRFPTEEDAIDFIVATKYKGGYICPNCGCVHKGIYHQNYDRRKLYCNNCKSEFSALVGTIFENTHLDLRVWLYAINLVVLSKKGISALQLQRETGIGSYRSAWRMLHQIRSCMGKESYKDTFDALVEIEETYVGGKPRRDNHHTPSSPKRGRGTDKIPVVGVKERSTGKIYAEVSLPDESGKQLTGEQLMKVLDSVCKEGITVMTDQFSGYNILDNAAKNVRKYSRVKVDHSTVFSLGSGKHTNGIEGCWSILKRAVFGIYHHISIKHMQNYVNEFCFRLNYRDCNEAFNKLVNLSVV